VKPADRKRGLTWPVVEMFGPTIQGEGVDQGTLCHFVRFGGCDYRCSWCDTPHAVLPEEVRLNMVRMNAEEIVNSLAARSDVPWVILSGGNPAMLNLTELVAELHQKGWRVAVETQGSKCPGWLAHVDRLCLSPKPPSSGMFEGFGSKQWLEVEATLEEVKKAGAAGLREPDWSFLKLVIFDEDDLRWAERVHTLHPEFKLYLSAGNDAGRTVGAPDRVDKRTPDEVRLGLIHSSRWLAQEVFASDVFSASDNVVIQSQYHVVLWGNEMGR